jgi:hypothetical protein
MKVIYKKNIYQQMDEEIERAKRIGHEIQKFVVTENEMEQMCMWVDVSANRDYGKFSSVAKTVDMYENGMIVKSYKGIPVEVE